jgi:predicted TIM-barrel fold metal-dependent hydrolase
MGRPYRIDTHQHIVPSPAALPSLIEVADPGRITYGTDFPFAPSVAIDFLNMEYENYPLTPPCARR